MNIFEKFSIVILPILLTAFFASIIPRKLKERQNFIEAVVEFRKVFNQALVDIQSNRFGVINGEIIKTHRVAYLNFRPHLHRAYRRQYDEAWEIYCYDFEVHENAEKDIEYLLKLTEYSVWDNILFAVERFWRILRLKVFGPDKKTKELVEKFLKDYQGKTLLP